MLIPRKCRCRRGRLALGESQRQEEQICSGGVSGIAPQGNLLASPSLVPHRVCLKANNVMCGVQWLIMALERKPQRAAHQSNYLGARVSTSPVK